MARFSRRAKGTEAIWLACLAAAHLIAALNGGCAEQPSPLPETISNADWKTVSSTTDGQWVTKVYHGWAGPSSQM